MAEEIGVHVRVNQSVNIILLKLRISQMFPNIHKEFTFTVHNVHQFEKVEWNKLVGVEINAKKYVLGQRRKLPSNADAAN